jgi:hypothetical protein
MGYVTRLMSQRQLRWVIPKNHIDLVCRSGSLLRQAPIAYNGRTFARLHKRDQSLLSFLGGILIHLIARWTIVSPVVVSPSQP